MSQFRVRGELSLDGSKWSAGLARAQGQASRFASTVASSVGARLAAVFSIGAATAFTRNTLEWAGNLRDVSDALGVSVEWLQKMANGAGLVGGKLEDIQTVMQEINKSRQDAISKPNGANAQAFAQLGVSRADISGLSAQDFFKKLVSAFANGSNAQLENSVVEVGGRSARKLMAAFVAQFESDAPIASEAMIDELDAIGDKFFELSNLLKVQLAPAILSVMDAGIGFINQLKQAGAGGSGFLTGFIKGLQDVVGSGTDWRDFLSRPFKEGWKQMQADVVGEANDQANRSDAAANAAAANVRRRRAREGASPSFSPLSSVASSARGGAPGSDSLVRVGNFLGDGGFRAMTSIAKMQLEMARRQTEYLKRIAEARTTEDLGI